MAAEVIMLLMLISLPLGMAETTLLGLECQTALGVVGQTTKISCAFMPSFKDVQITIARVHVSNSSQNDPVFTFPASAVTGDTRFKLPSANDPSLELSNPSVTDEGEYVYMLITNRGIIKNGAFRISVTAKYNEPVINSRPEKIEDGGHADLYCNASGGYPAGFIHWFDSFNTNWTKSATLDIKEEENKLLKLSSKLTFNKIDLSWAPFRCVILNKKLVKEGESVSHLKIIDNSQGSSVTVGVTVAVFIGIIALTMFLFRRKRIQRSSAMHTDEAEAEANADDTDEQSGECFEQLPNENMTDST